MAERLTTVYVLSCSDWRYNDEYYFRNDGVIPEAVYPTESAALEAKYRLEREALGNSNLSDYGLYAKPGHTVDEVCDRFKGRPGADFSDEYTVQFPNDLTVEEYRWIQERVSLPEFYQVTEVAADLTSIMPM